MSEWRAIAGFRGVYQVSADGRIRSIDRWCAGPHGGLRLWRGRILRPTRNKAGYLQVSPCIDGTPIKCDLHTLILETFIGARPPGMEARHLNGRKCDTHLSNLRWGTVEENTADKLAHGHVLKGETHGSAVLRSGDVDRIRDLRRASFSAEKIARWLGLNPSTVKNVVYGSRWVST